MGRKKLIGTITQKKDKLENPPKENSPDGEPTYTTGNTKPPADKPINENKLKGKKAPKDANKPIVDGDYDLSDLDEEFDIEDYMDPEYFTEDDDMEEGFDPRAEMICNLFDNFFQYDNQNIVETMCQVRDAIDANSKCLLRVAHEIRNLQNAYVHINMEKEDEKVLDSIPKAP